MRFLAVILLLSVGLCRELHFYHHTGDIVINDDKQKINGVILIEMDERRNATFISGMLDDREHHHHSVEFGAVIEKVTYNEDKSFVIKAVFKQGRIGQHMIHNLHGDLTITGTWDKVSYDGHASDQEERHKIHVTATGIKSKCGFYSMAEAGKRANYLVGENAHEFHPVEVLNYAIFGYPYLHHHGIEFYRNHFGQETKAFAPGVIILGNDDDHAAIINSDGDKFVHSHRGHHTHVEVHPVSDLHKYFPAGYILKEYKCTETF